MKILVINCGSSSLKFRLIDIDGKKVLATGNCERITINNGHFKYERPGKEKIEKDIDFPNHDIAVGVVLKTLLDKEIGVIKDLSEISAIGHRVVHGGDKFFEATLITDEVINDIEACCPLAPLHNPAHLMGIRACKKAMPNTKMVAVFDTAYHHTIPEEAYLYGIPYEYYEKYKVRKYGFHGTSHAYVSKRTAEIMGKDYNSINQIVCHLGNGASITAIKNGKSIDTSMGYTPLEGIIMGTRSGNIDPEVVKVITEKENVSVGEALTILNKKSGVYGLSGYISSDMRDLEEEYNKGNPNAIRAFKCYVYAILKYIGSYVLVLGKVDAITFTAGIGEHNSLIRRLIMERLNPLGITLDNEKNDNVHGECLISGLDSKIKVYVVPTDEEMSIAMQTKEIVSKL